jgi:hypothetical protein
MVPSHGGIAVIKVQPARSRLVKSETPERITLTMPRRGLFSRAGGLAAGSLLWIGTVAAVLAMALRRSAYDYATVIGVLGLPGLIGLAAALSSALRSWSIERDAQWLTVRRSGLFGSARRRWPAEDVGSFYVRDAAPGADLSVASRLVAGFRNGRSEDLIHDGDEEDLRWAAAMMSDSRGARRSSSPLVLAGEPERKKVDPAIVPASLTCRTFEGGIEVTFLPLLRSKGLWWRLPLAALLGTIAIVGASVVLYRATRGAFPPAVPRIAIATLLGVTAWRLVVLQRWAAVQILDGIVTINQGRRREAIQFGVGEVQFVQTFRRGRRTELQFLLKDKPKVCLLEGRPGPELDWAARFLRVAIKGRTAVPEDSTLKVDAAAGDCPVCLEKTDRRAVFCAKCRTPAHEECWSYMGMCSTYGCREIRFDRA